MRPLPPAAITGYHAHVYYEAATRRSAAAIRTDLIARFPIRLGRWRDAPVGPHPQAMFQAAFEPALFGEIVPWLMLNRRGHSVLVHPITGEGRADQLDYPLWLGERLALDFGGFD